MSLWRIAGASNGTRFLRNGKGGNPMPTPKLLVHDWPTAEEAREAAWKVEVFRPSRTAIINAATIANRYADLITCSWRDRNAIVTAIREKGESDANSTT
jgi:hypothetical protein